MITTVIPPGPKGLRMNAEDHAKLIRAMLTAQTPSELYRARDAVFAAYQPWIAQRASSSSRSLQATGDRIAQAYASALGAISTYDPASGIPLHKHLIDKNRAYARALLHAGSRIDIAGEKKRRVLPATDRRSPRPAWWTAPARQRKTAGDTLPCDKAGREGRLLITDGASDIPARLALDHRPTPAAP